MERRQAPDADEDSFYERVTVLESFDKVAQPSLYQPLPAGWLVGNADIVQSTRAKADGRAKAVNMAGAAVIAAVTNALSGRQFPYVFGGDGASFALPQQHAATAGTALAAVAAWVEANLDLRMRTGMVPIGAIRDAGFDVCVARYAASRNVRYAMFSGGGVRWAESQIKLGRFALSPADAAACPDLTGLSCNWEPIPTSLGVILTLIIVPQVGFEDPRFIELVERLNALLERRRALALSVAAEGSALPLAAVGLRPDGHRHAASRRIGGDAADPAGAGVVLRRAGALDRA